MGIGYSKFAMRGLGSKSHLNRSGKDAERLLPVLSNYLGHVHVSCTYWYLQSWPELMQEVMARLERRKSQWNAARRRRPQ
jgi:hypothetical protein